MISKHYFGTRSTLTETAIDLDFPVSSIHHPKIAAWRILFLIEGCPSVLLALCVFLFLPNRPQTSKYLNENERTLCNTRLNADNSDEGHTGIDWNGVKRAFLDWKTYVVSIMCEWEERSGRPQPP